MFIPHKLVNTKEWDKYRHINCKCGSTVFRLCIYVDGAANLMCVHCGLQTHAVGYILSLVEKSLLETFNHNRRF